MAGRPAVFASHCPQCVPRGLVPVAGRGGKPPLLDERILNLQDTCLVGLRLLRVKLVLSLHCRGCQQQRDNQKSHPHVGLFLTHSIQSITRWSAFKRTMVEYLRSSSFSVKSVWI